MKVKCKACDGEGKYEVKHPQWGSPFCPEAYVYTECGECDGSGEVWGEEDVEPIKPRRHKAEPGECKLCDQMREENREWHPSHDASRNCQSGQRAHCSCDTCF